MKNIIFIIPLFLIACASGNSKITEADLTYTEEKSLDSEIESLKVLSYFSEQNLTADLSMLRLCEKERFVLTKALPDLFFVRKNLKFSNFNNFKTKLVKTNVAVNLSKSTSKIDMLNFYQAKIDAIESLNAEVSDALLNCRLKSGIESVRESNKDSSNAILRRITYTEEDR